VVFFTDIESGRLACVEPIQEEDTRRVRRYVREVMGQVGAEELRTDEHSVYAGIVGAEGGHRLCLTHWRKSKGKRAYDLYLSRLVGRYICCRRGLLWKINQLLQHVERTWEMVGDDPVDPTNNATERIIGLNLKIGSRTMRGFKSQRKVLEHAYLSSFLRGRDGVCDLRKVI